MSAEHPIPQVCKLTTPELRQRKVDVISQLKQLVRQKEELKDGFSYLFDGSDDIYDLVTAFIKSERQCCSFFNFSLSVNNNNTLLLSITGEWRAKDFIVQELEF